MAFVKQYTVYGSDQPDKQVLSGFRHWHGDTLELHTHLVGQPSEYVEWVWDVLVQRGDHFHRMES